MTILLAWLGNTDLRASEASGSDGQGPILGAAAASSFEALHLLSDHDEKRTRAYTEWLSSQTRTRITPHQVQLTSPTSFEEIFRRGQHCAR